MKKKGIDVEDSLQLPITRMAILFFATFGIYILAWLFRTNDWLSQNSQKTDNEIWFFFPILHHIFMYRQLIKVKNFLQEKKKEITWSAGWIIFFMLLIGLFQGNFSNAVDVIDLIIISALSALYVIPLSYIQKSINEYQYKQEKVKPDWSLFSKDQIGWLIFGAILWIVLILII